MEVFIRIIIFTIVCYVIESAVSGLYSKAKLKTNGTDVDKNHYIVKIPDILGNVTLVNVVLAVIILVVNLIVWKTKGIMGDGMVQFCLIYGGLFLLFYAGIKLWWIKVDEDNFEIHRFLRRVKHAKFSEVERVREDKWHQLVVYTNGHKLIRVNLLCDNRDLFDESLINYGVDMSSIPSSEEIINEIEEKKNKK